MRLVGSGRGAFSGSSPGVIRHGATRCVCAYPCPRGRRSVSRRPPEGGLRCAQSTRVSGAARGDLPSISRFISRFADAESCFPPQRVSQGTHGVAGVTAKEGEHARTLSPHRQTKRNSSRHPWGGEGRGVPSVSSVHVVRARIPARGSQAQSPAKRMTVSAAARHCNLPRENPVELPASKPTRPLH